MLTTSWWCIKIVGELLLVTTLLAMHNNSCVSHIHNSSKFPTNITEIITVKIEQLYFKNQLFANRNEITYVVEIILSRFIYGASISPFNVFLYGIIICILITPVLKSQWDHLRLPCIHKQQILTFSCKACTFA